jgi:hypothetical protein
MSSGTLGAQYTGFVLRHAVQVSKSLRSRCNAGSTNLAQFIYKCVILYQLTISKPHAPPLPSITQPLFADYNHHHSHAAGDGRATRL